MWPMTASLRGCFVYIHKGHRVLGWLRQRVGAGDMQTKVTKFLDDMRKLSVDAADLRELASYKRKRSLRAYLGTISVDLERCVAMLEEALDEGN